jgi:hypothetical protein
MVTKDDNILDGLSYEDSLYVVCGEDVDRFWSAMEKIQPILEKIPIGWSDKR